MEGAEPVHEEIEYTLDDVVNAIALTQDIIHAPHTLADFNDENKRPPQKYRRKLILADMLQAVDELRFESKRNAKEPFKGSTIADMWKVCCEKKNEICALEVMVEAPVANQPTLYEEQLKDLFSNTINETHSVENMDPKAAFKFLRDNKHPLDMDDATFGALDEQQKRDILRRAFTAFLQQKNKEMVGKSEDQIDLAVRTCGRGLFNLRTAGTMRTHAPKAKLLVQFLTCSELLADKVLTDEGGKIAAKLVEFSSMTHQDRMTDTDGLLKGFFEQVTIQHAELFLGTLREHTEATRELLQMQTLRDGQGIFAQDEVGALPTAGRIRLKARTVGTYRSANGVFLELCGVHPKQNPFVKDQIKDVVRGWGKEDAKNGIRTTSAAPMPFRLMKSCIELNQKTLSTSTPKQIADHTSICTMMAIGFTGNRGGDITRTRCSDINYVHDHNGKGYSVNLSTTKCGGTHGVASMKDTEAPMVVYCDGNTGYCSLCEPKPKEERDDGICVACLIHDQRKFLKEVHPKGWVATEQDWMFPAYTVGPDDNLVFTTKKGVPEFAKPIPPEYLDAQISHNVHRYNLDTKEQHYEPKVYTRHSLKLGASKHGCDHRLGLNKQMLYLRHGTAAMAYHYAQDVATNATEMWRQVQLTPECAMDVLMRKWMKGVDSKLDAQMKELAQCKMFAHASLTYAQSCLEVLKLVATKFDVAIPETLQPPVFVPEQQPQPNQQVMYNPQYGQHQQQPEWQWQHQQQWQQWYQYQWQQQQQQQQNQQQHQQQQQQQPQHQPPSSAAATAAATASPQMTTYVPRRVKAPNEMVICPHEFCSKTLARTSMANHHSRVAKAGLANPSQDKTVGDWMKVGNAHVFSHTEARYHSYVGRRFFAPEATNDPTEFRCAKAGCFRKFVDVSGVGGCECDLAPPLKRSKTS